MADIRLPLCDQDETSLLHALEDRPWCFLSPVESDDGPDYAGSESEALLRRRESLYISSTKRDFILQTQT